jgi:hypothetical protein
VLGRVMRYLINLRSGFRYAPCAAGGCAVLLLVSGCGSSTSTAASPSSGSSSFSSYLSCLRQHGVNVPTARPTNGAGGPGGFGGGSSSTAEKARQACASLRPTGASGGFGRFGGAGDGFAAAFQAFRSCMASHGETIPTARPAAPPTSAPSSGTDRFLNGLNPSNPKVAAALNACQSKLPTFPSGDG